MPVTKSKPKNASIKLVKITPQLSQIRATTIEERSILKPWSNSRLVDINTCPIWGVVHGQRKYETSARAMALEAGETMHQVFAAVRIWQLQYTQKLPRHAKAAALRIFGKERWKRILEDINFELDAREQLMQLAFAVLHTSGYEDNPEDNVRTLSNMEMASIQYIDEKMMDFDNFPVWVADRKDPKKPVGIEQVFDVVLEFADGLLIRFIGTLDGIVQNLAKEGRLTLEENKTASRLDEAWKYSFDMAHQVTGYMACGSAVFGIPLYHGRVLGLKIKPANRGEDYCAINASRNPDAILHWARWVRHTVDIAELYKDDFENAPRYTHSCNRYFRPCSLIPFCCDDAAGRQIQWSQMVPVEGSPSERAVRD